MAEAQTNIVYRKLLFKFASALLLLAVIMGVAAGFIIHASNGSLLLVLSPLPIAMIIAFVALLVVNHLTLKPIKEITRKVQDFTEGNLGVRITVRSNDELGQLGTTFNQMAEKLQGFYGNLAMLVDDRTEELKKEEARLRASINSLSIGYIMTGPDNEQLLINKAAETILTSEAQSAYPATRAIDTNHMKGKIDMQLLQTAFGEKLDIAKQLSDSRQQKKTIILRDVPYKMLHLNLYVTPVIHEESQGVLGSVLLIEDVTEQKIMERSKDEFFSIASHELRTPLTAIRGNSDMIQQYYSDKFDDPNLKEMIADIHESANRLIAIVNDFLDTSRLEQKHMKFELAAIDMILVADSVIKEYQVTGSRQKVHLEVKHPDQSLPLVYADKNRTKQVLINLIGNALKFTDNGSVIVSFEPGAGFVKLSVSDTGRGMTAEAQKLLFKKFEQTGSSVLTRDSVRGTGLGLYISKMIVEQMGGRIQLESSDTGEGTTFSFSLPTSDSSGRNDAKPA